MMADPQLTCNLSSCRRKLTKQACVTSCSHIFCAEHMQDMLGQACLACGSRLNSDLLDCVHTDLNPSDQYKAMVLTGLNPHQVIEIATRAINFFIYQLNYEKQNKAKMLRQRKGQVEELQHYCNTLTAKYKADYQKHMKIIEDLQQELQEKIQEIEANQQLIAQCQRENMKLKTKIDAYKQELGDMRRFPQDSSAARSSTFQPFFDSRDMKFLSSENQYINSGKRSPLF